MNRRLTMLAGALAIALSRTAGDRGRGRAQCSPTSNRQPSALATPRTASTGSAPTRRAALRVHRAADGDVEFVSSTNGGAMLDGDDAPPRGGSAQEQLARYGDAFGIDGDLSRAVVQQTLDSATGGSIVRADQVVDGVPVFGGQIVMSLDEDQGVVSVDTATTEADRGPRAPWSARRGRSAPRWPSRPRPTGSAPTTLTATGEGSPALRPRHRAHLRPHGCPTGLGVRGHQRLRHPGAGAGRHRPRRDRPALQRRPEHQPRGLRQRQPQDHQRHGRRPEVPERRGPRGGRPPRRARTSNQAYDNLGATSDAYDQLAGIDLTELVGATAASGDKALMSTVRWCFDDDECLSYNNAFWDGTQMVFGAGFAAADDVVAHELTHGYVERHRACSASTRAARSTSPSADVIGRDRRPPQPRLHRRATPAGRIGEDLPGRAASAASRTPASTASRTG